MPSAALIDVLEWPTPKVSNSLSPRGGEGREPVLLLDGVQLAAAAGEHLVRIGLVAHVPHDAVVRRVVDIMERDGQLDRAEARREVPAARGDVLDQKVAQLRRELGQLGNCELLQVAGRFDAREERILVSRGRRPCWVARPLCKRRGFAS